MKKGLFILVLAVIVAGGVFAQKSSTPAPQSPSQGAQRATPTQAKSSSAPKNWFSGEVSILGAGIRFEHMLSDKMSLGGNIYYNNWLFLFGDDIGATFSFRFYPWGGNGNATEGMYFGGALGFHMGWYGWLSSYIGSWGNFYGAEITPEFGWKIDVGSPGGFFIEPGVKIPLLIGVRKWSWWYENEYRFKFDWGGAIFYFGMGAAF
jgi:hypothetical protein